MIRHHHILGLILVPLGVAVGCADDGPDDGPGELPTWTLVETHRFGGAPEEDTPDGLLLSGLRDLVRQGDRLYVADVPPGTPGRVLVLDLEGRRLSEVGRVGQGPGEYRVPDQLQVLGDTAWVIDASGGKAEGYVEGQPVVSVQVPLRDGRARAVPRGVTSGGHVLVGYRRAVFEIVAGDATSAPLVRVDRSGAVADTVLTVPFVAEDFWEVDGTPGHMPLKQGPLTVLSGDGSRLIEVRRPPWREGTPRAYTIGVIPLDGGEGFSIDVPYEPRPTDVDAVMEAVVAGLSPDPSSEVVRTIRERLGAFPHRPPVLAVARSERGVDHLWVRRDDPTPRTAPWDVISLERRERIARVWAPPAMRILRVSADEVWGAMSTPLGVPAIVRYELEKDGTGSG